MTFELTAFLFLPLAAVDNDVIFTMFVATNTTVFATNTLLHNTLHLRERERERGHKSSFSWTASSHHSLAVATNSCPKESVLNKLMSESLSQRSVSTQEVREELIVADHTVTGGGGKGTGGRERDGTGWRFNNHNNISVEIKYFNVVSCL